MAAEAHATGQGHFLSHCNKKLTQEDRHEPTEDGGSQAEPTGNLVAENKAVEGVDGDGAGEVGSSRVPNLGKNPCRARLSTCSPPHPPNTVTGSP